MSEFEKAFPTYPDLIESSGVFAESEIQEIRKEGALWMAKEVIARIKELRTFHDLNPHELINGLENGLKKEIEALDNKDE